MLESTLRQLPRLLIAGSVLMLGELCAASTTQLTLLNEPIKVTGDFDTADIGNYVPVQIGVHNGPIAQLVTTSVIGKTASEVERTLKQQVAWHAPYLFVHASCGGGNAWRCEGEVAFKVTGTTITRLGDLIGGDTKDVYHDGYFFDVYDKLEAAVDGLSHATSPVFKIALDDVNGALSVNPELTWTSNANEWRKRAEFIATTHPNKDWQEAQWEDYFSAIVNNAALARYCNRRAELQSLLKTSEAELDAYRRRALADALSRVVPLEKPKAWRKPY